MAIVYTILWLFAHLTFVLFLVGFPVNVLVDDGRDARAPKSTPTEKKVAYILSMFLIALATMYIGKWYL